MVGSAHRAWLRAIPAQCRPATLESVAVSAQEETAPVGPATPKVLHAASGRSGATYLRAG